MTGIEILFAYGLKILAGCLYGYIFLHYYKGDDTWLLHWNSLKEKQILLNDPSRFFSEFTPEAAIRNGHSIPEILRLYFNDLEYCLQAKTIGIINILSQGNYYINTIFWNFLIFWGHYWFFKLLVNLFPAKRKFYFLLIFCFPPVVFWLSGIRADGLLFAAFALLVLYFYKWLRINRWWYFIFSIIGFIGVLIFRLPIAGLLAPSLISMWLANRFSRRPLLQFAWVYSLAIIVFFISIVSDSYNMPAMIVKRQQEFMRLKGTSLQLDTLQPTVRSFAAIFPQAVSNSFVRPHPLEAKGMLQQMAAVEIIIFWGMFILVFFFPASDWKTIIVQPIILFLFFWSISLYIFIGYAIPFPGAIVRYKIIGELCILTALITLIKKPAFKKLK